jgi:hypothetical protein
MKKTFTLLMFLMLGVMQVGAQIPCDSPIPVKFKISTDAGYSNSFEYFSVESGWAMDTLLQTITAPLVWAVDINNDTLCCDSIAMDLTGKIAMIRRFSCYFSLKMLWAQKAGAVGVVIADRLVDPDGPFCMVNGGEGDQVHIPGIFISLSDAGIIDQKIRAGETVTATFEVGRFGGPRGHYQLYTPQSAAVPVDDAGVLFINNTSELMPSVTVNLDFKDPVGNVTTLSKTLTNVPPATAYTVKMDDSYLPSMIGEYNIHYSYSLGDETYDKKFFISDYVYAQDNFVIDTSLTEDGQFAGTIEPDSAGFAGANYTYDFGNFFHTGTKSQVATHVSFILGSYNELWTGDPEADVFKIRIYDADPDGNGNVPDATTYDELDEADKNNPPIASADYILDGETPNFTNVFVELDEPLTLEPNKIYLVMVQYNGVNAGIAIPPKPALGVGSGGNITGLSSARYANRFLRSGWGGDFDKFAVRLFLDGWLTGTEEPLDKSKISLSPNPATDVVRLQLDLEKPAADVTIRIMDFNGRLLRTEQLENVQKGTYPISVKDLANGAYFLTVVTPEGFRSKKFQVMR